VLFKKAGALWMSKKKDKYGLPFMNGVIDEAVGLNKGQKIFIFQTDPSKRGPKSPFANIVIGFEGENNYEPPIAPEPEEEPMPEPLPDDTVPF
jgi:hypothetical protein